MKTSKALFTALILTLTFGMSTYASDSGAMARAKNDLKRQIQHELKGLAFSDIQNLEECCVISLTFVVKEDNSIEILNVTSENEDLERHARIMLEKNGIVADDILIGHKYRVPMRFVNKA